MFEILISSKIIISNMKVQNLEEFGLSKNESKVYLSLLKLGESTAGQIADHSKIHRTNVYDSIERLSEKGLVSYITKNKVKYYVPADPNNLMNILNEKQARLKEIMPSLLIDKELSNKTEVQVFEGVVAARNALMGLLRHDKDIFMYGVPAIASKVLGQFCLDRFQNERIKKKIHQRLIYNEDAEKRVKELKEKNLCEIKILPPEFNSPMSINICNDEVFMCLFSREPCLLIQIFSKDIADIYLKYFYVMWDLAKPI
jgi:predicted transcriptional regulator